MSEAVVDFPELVDVVPAQGALDARPKSGPTGGELTDLEREILAFERKWWRFAGAKEEAVRELFDMSSTRYYQALNTLIDQPAALAQDAALVNRLRRMRSTRQRSARLADENA